MDLKLIQMDIKTTCLHRELDEEMVHKPGGFTSMDLINKICKLEH